MSKPTFQVPKSTDPYRTLDSIYSGQRNINLTLLKKATELEDFGRSLTGGEVWRFDTPEKIALLKELLKLRASYDKSYGDFRALMNCIQKVCDMTTDQRSYKKDRKLNEIIIGTNVLEDQFASHIRPDKLTLKSVAELFRAELQHEPANCFKIDLAKINFEDLKRTVDESISRMNREYETYRQALSKMQQEYRASKVAAPSTSKLEEASKFGETPKLPKERKIDHAKILRPSRDQIEMDKRKNSAKADRKSLESTETDELSEDTASVGVAWLENFLDAFHSALQSGQYKIQHPENFTEFLDITDSEKRKAMSWKPSEADITRSAVKALAVELEFFANEVTKKGDYNAQISDAVHTASQDLGGVKNITAALTSEAWTTKGPFNKIALAKMKDKNFQTAILEAPRQETKRDKKQKPK